MTETEASELRFDGGVVVNDLGSSTMGGQDHDSGPAETVAQEIRDEGRGRRRQQRQRCHRDGAERMVAQAIEEFGQLDILVNNGGMIRNRTFLNIGAYEFEPVPTFTSTGRSSSLVPPTST